MRGFTLRFRTYGACRLMKIMYECGIGGKNSLGFGMVRTANLTGFENLSGLKRYEQYANSPKGVADQSDKEQLDYGKFYHIYNCGINGCNLFNEPDNYQYFLGLYDKHISLVADTYAWVLMPNHFHLLVRIKDEADIRTSLEEIAKISRMASSTSTDRILQT